MRNWSKNKTRYPIIDSLRGLSVLGMVIFHANYLLENVFSRDIIPLWDLFWKVLGYSVAVTFIFLAGLVSLLSANGKSLWVIMRKALNRTLILSLVALGISVSTYAFIPEQAISWGIIHFLALSSIVGVFTLRGGYLNLFWGILFLTPPYITLPTLHAWFLIPLGFPPLDFFSADYYPLIPWFGYYLLGQGIANLGIRYDILRYLKNESLSNVFLSFLGKHALLIYILHVPILYGIFFLYFR